MTRRAFTPTPGSPIREGGEEWRGVPKGIAGGHGRKAVVWGFTLLEVMLAIALVAVSMVAIIEAMQRAQAGMADGENLLIATHLAQRRLEELRNTSYASLASETKASVATPSGYSRFSREVTVTTPYANLKQVVVTVYWNAPGGETSLSLRTCRSNS